MNALIGPRIRQARLESELTLDQLSARVGTRKSHLSMVERGLKRCSVDLLVRICIALEVGPGWILKTAMGNTDV